METLDKILLGIMLASTLLCLSPNKYVQAGGVASAAVNAIALSAVQYNRINRMRGQYEAEDAKRVKEIKALRSGYNTK